MTGIIFYYEPSEVDVWSGKKFDAWHYACKACGDIDKAIIINRTDQHVTSFDKAIDVQIVTDETFVLPEGKIAQVVTPREYANSISLWDFDHQVDWYIFGPASGWLEDEGANISNIRIHIPVSNNMELHSVHIATTVLLHRREVI